LKKRQRALVLGGGGAVGAYQAGVLKILCKILIDEDKRKWDNSRDYDHDGKSLLFDIIAGTSIGAMNGAVLLSQYLRTGSWETAVEQLEHFWTDKEKGLASTVSEEDLKKVVGWGNWQEQSNKGTLGIASAEAARRYYSVIHYFFNGASKVHECIDPPRGDSRFFYPLNSWYIHKPDRLKNTILNFAQHKIATSHWNNQPRLLVFSVDVAEGKTVTFDSYHEGDGSRKSEQSTYKTGKNGGHGNDMIKNNKNSNSNSNSDHYKGVSIDHVMASGTLPEFYDYKEIDGRKFWDGGLLSNTPFRELLQAHQEYWLSVVTSQTGKEGNSNNNICIPDLEVYIVNLHPSKREDLPTDYDVVKDRENDILFGDRSSHYDEKMTYLVADLRDFAAQMKNLSAEAISKVTEGSDKKELQKKFDDILGKITTTACNKGFNDNSSSEQNSTYDDLLNGQYRITKVVRIERGERADYDYYADSISGKSGDFTAKTIAGLIEEGKRDAMNATLV
jgi:NTE family protein